MAIVHILGTILLLTVVGAVIGGVTNSIAIKMLFKPYHPMMIGKWRLPFTPGLIPKRHEEIAEELGKLVMKHLIRADSLEEKMLDPRFKQRLVQLAREKVLEWLSSDLSISELFSVACDDNIRKLEHRSTEWLLDQLKQFVRARHDQTFDVLIPADWQRKVEHNMPVIAEHLTSRVTAYLESDEGKAMIKEQFDRFFEAKKGFISGMISLFLGNDSLVDKLYPDFIAFLKRPSFTTMIEDWLRSEWRAWMEKSLEDLTPKVDLEKLLADGLRDWLASAMPFRKWAKETPGALLKDIQPLIMDRWIPRGVDVFLRFTAVRIPEILKTLDLEQIVSEQVRAFSIKELEEVVLFISKKEFKMITYLGALLGGLIGLVQAVIVLFMG
ncbi:DUF445 family protein [Camelliibacillus cellulosilyticus]|uniref:DUF445 family protein n=1 Tax=Camelliibacillus cellulosilyticus TaxID=2174486 RepID=A0ABV9GNC6_9BACL